MSAIDDLYARTRAAVSSVSPALAARRREEGALLVDIRPVEQRSTHGEIAGAAVIDRNVLEWRLDPTSPHRHPACAAADLEIVVFCQQGYASVLAVATLGRLGLTDVHDLSGGFEAWVAAGLPVEHPPAAPLAPS